MHRGSGLGDSVKYWVKPDIENRIREGSIAAHFSAEVTEIRPTEVVVGQVPREGSSRGFSTEVPHENARTIPAEAVLLLTGYRADPGFLRAAGVEVDPDTLVPRHDPATFETNVPGLFIAGGQLAGKRTGAIFIENGRFHGEQIAKVLAARAR